MFRIFLAIGSKVNKTLQITEVKQLKVEIFVYKKKWKSEQFEENPKDFKGINKKFVKLIKLFKNYQGKLKYFQLEFEKMLVLEEYQRKFGKFEEIWKI